MLKPIMEYSSKIEQLFLSYEEKVKKIIKKLRQNQQKMLTLFGNSAIIFNRVSIDFWQCRRSKNSA